MAHMMTRRRQSLAACMQSCRIGFAATSSITTSSRRAMSTTSVRRSADPSPTELTASMQEAQTSEEAGQHRDALAPAASKRSGPVPATYQAWRATQGKAFEQTPRGEGPFWLGRTPFPLNPSFVPNAPVPHVVRKTMWKLHSSDPLKNSTRFLAGRFSIPMERVAAILRLMALESEFRGEGKPLQTPFQEQMERLLGSKTSMDLGLRENAALAMSDVNDVRGSVYDETGPSKEEQEKESVIKAALDAETVQRRDRIRLLGTGGPSFKGAPVSSSTNDKGSTASSSSSSSLRPTTTFIDLSSRPESYAGAGTLMQNQKRAAQRAANKARRRERRASYMRRYELSQRILSGDRSPELLEEKRTLDSQKVEMDRIKLAERMKKYKTKKKYKRAMKALRSTPPKKK